MTPEAVRASNLSAFLDLLEPNVSSSRRADIDLWAGRSGQRPERLQYLGVRDDIAKSGLPGLSLVRTCFDAQGNLMTFDRDCWRRDAFTVSADVRVR